MSLATRPMQQDTEGGERKRRGQRPKREKKEKAGPEPGECCDL